MLGGKTIQFIDRDLKEELRQELATQGHRLTGALEESLTTEFQFGTNTALEIFAEGYINPVSDGVPAANIPYSGRTGNGGTSKYIQGLANYARLRFGLTDEKAALSAAFAIAAKHKKEGMPTRGSYQFSSNGKRTRAIDEALDNYDLDSKIESGLSDELDELLNMNELVII